MKKTILYIILIIATIVMGALILWLNKNVLPYASETQIWLVAAIFVVGTLALYYFGKPLKPGYTRLKSIGRCLLVMIVGSASLYVMRLNSPLGFDIIFTLIALTAVLIPAWGYVQIRNKFKSTESNA